MPKFTIESSHLAGFVAEAKKPGETEVKVQVKCNLVTSDKPIFHVWMKHISSLFLAKVPIPIPLIHKFLIILHNNDMADIYINDFNEIMQVRVKESVKAGDIVTTNNISDLTGLYFPEIEIDKNDVIIYGLRTNWRFSLYYDFSRDVVSEIITKELGELKKEAIFYDLYASANANINSAIMEDADALIFTEGKSDWKHFSRAAEELKIASNLLFWTSEDSVGSDDLYKMCEHYARIPQPTRMIFLFDRDEEAILKKLRKKENNGGGFQSWGNNVYSLYLPLPPGRSDSTHFISLEFFYSDHDLKTINSEGRRLYLSSEFNKRTGNHLTENSHCTARNKYSKDRISIIDCDVFDRKNNSIALSKDDFAEGILNKEPIYNSINFSNFNLIFDLLSAILKHKD
jgi:hypothetical protein